MILSDLLGSEVFDADGRRLGRVADVRFEISGAPGHLLAATELVGLLVSPTSRSSIWGYERRTERGPLLIAALQRWLHRGMFLVAWEDVERIETRRVTLREGYAALDAMLPEVQVTRH